MCLVSELHTAVSSVSTPRKPTPTQPPAISIHGPLTCQHVPKIRCEPERANIEFRASHLRTSPRIVSVEFKKTLYRGTRI